MNSHFPVITYVNTCESLSFSFPKK